MAMLWNPPVTKDEICQEQWERELGWDSRRANVGHSTHRGGFLKPCGRSLEDSGKTLKSWERRMYGNHMSWGLRAE